MHILGDLHQPFHSVGRCIPDGSGGHKQDLGGNLWGFTVDEKSTNMHTYWDAGGNALDARYLYFMHITHITHITFTETHTRYVPIHIYMCAFVHQFAKLSCCFGNLV